MKRFTVFPRLSLLILAFSSFCFGGEAVVLDKKVNFFDLIREGKVDYHVDQSYEIKDAPEDIWQLKDKELHISGRGYGYVVSKDNYENYHLVLEYKWGEKTWGKRENRARDNGLILHAFGPPGALWGTWLPGIEANIIEGGVGDILVLSTTEERDGTVLTASAMAAFKPGKNGKGRVWEPTAKPERLTRGRIDWRDRDLGWEDVKGFRGEKDVESPFGEWTRIECISDAGKITVIVNGEKVNEVTECSPSLGQILLQSEGAEMFIRRFELWPVGEFKEEWK